MEKNNNVPKIRFKGFYFDWESHKFSKTFAILSNNTLSRAELNYDNGSTKNVHYGDVLIKFRECLDASKEQLPYITNGEIADKYSSSYLQNGDIVIADTAEDETAGKCTELLNIQDDRIIAGLHTIPCHPMFSFANRYLGYFLNSPAFHNQLIPLMQGTKVIGVSKSAIKDTNIHYPKIEEQALIGIYFQNLDTLINANQNKLNKLKNIKAACLEKMFPKKGSNVPEIRFKKFTGEWKEKILGEIGDPFAGLSGKTKEDFGHGNAKIITYMNIFTNPIAKALGTECVEIDDKQNKVLYGDILFTTSSETPEEVGMSSIWLVHDDNVYLNSFCFGYRLKEEANPYYMAYLLRSQSVRKKIAYLAQGISRYNISKNKVMEISLPFPSPEEQIQIGSFFKKIDDLISQNDQQIQKLKNIKKACLERFFVNMEKTI